MFNFLFIVIVFGGFLIGIVQLILAIVDAVSWNSYSKEKKARVQRECLQRQQQQAEEEKSETFICADCKKSFPKIERKKSDFDGRSLCKKCYDADVGRIVNTHFH